MSKLPTTRDVMVPSNSPGVSASRYPQEFPVTGDLWGVVAGEPFSRLIIQPTDQLGQISNWFVQKNLRLFKIINQMEVFV